MHFDTRTGEILNASLCLFDGFFSMQKTMEILFTSGADPNLSLIHIFASCNNIIRQVEKKDSTFFEYGEVEKNMVLGEMYGVRALLHFEVYRLFAPAPVKGYKLSLIHI